MKTLNLGSNANPNDESRPALRLNDMGDGTHELHTHDPAALEMLTAMRDALVAFAQGQAQIVAAIRAMEARQVAAVDRITHIDDTLEAFKDNEDGPPGQRVSVAVKSTVASIL